MSEQGSLPAYWDEQQQIMSKRPRGRRLREQKARAQAQHMLPKLQPAAAPAAEQPGLEQLWEKAGRVGAWLLATDTTHARWAEGAAAYIQLQEQMRALEDERIEALAKIFPHLRKPGDEYRGVVIFPADYPGPLLGGSWRRLSDGRIEARLSLFELRIMRELRDTIAGSTESR
jgi:hypothetical protein